MSFFDFLTMAGGLALFLYGMNLLGEGLSKASGGRLERILEKLTSSPLKAVLVGAGVTAVIQSSSAATVMIVGFVNSGIMRLEQAVGIIMGANIGTTITSWILGMTGIDSSSFLIRMLKPTSFSPILAIVGVAILMFSHKEARRNTASILIGFSVLMFGMDTMSSAVEPLAEVPEFTGILTRFSQPLLGMLAGLVLTAVIQSSSASVGILQALCATGAVSYGAAVPIIMGQNIGTCVTAMISGIGASKNARRAALIHLYFNVIGTFLFMIIFYAADSAFSFDFLKDSATPFGIAAVHSIFNITATLCLLPFSKGLVRLACLTIKDGEKQEEVSSGDRILHLLDPRFLEMPSYAVEQSRSVAAAMAGMAEEAMNISMSLLFDYDQKKAERVAELERESDRFEDELGSYLVKLSAKDLAERDSRTLSDILHCIGDFERISDHALNVKEAAERLYGGKLKFSGSAQDELRVMERAIHDILKISMLSFSEEDLSLARQVEPLEEVIDGLHLEMKQRHIERLRRGECTVELGFILSDVLTDFERVSDHCSNIALCLLQASSNEFDTHACLRKIKDNDDFRSRVSAYRERYRLQETSVQG